MGQFSAGTINNAVASFTNSLTRILIVYHVFWRIKIINTRTVTEDILNIFLYSKKCSHLRRLRCLE